MFLNNVANLIKLFNRYKVMIIFNNFLNINPINNLKMVGPLQC